MKPTLVDTSVWIDHLRKRDERLVALLEADLVVVHSGVIGELACGSLKRRSEVLGNLSLLPKAVEASSEEVLAMIDARKLFGRGVGWVDAQLLASAALSGAQLWSRDRRLMALVER